jgi:hypothetical protein
VADNIGVRVTGGRKLRRALNDAGIGITELKEAHRQAARIVESAAEARAPVRSGELRRSLRSSGTNTAGIVRAGNKDVIYANPIHWGWPARHIRPNPFVAEAAGQTEHRWLTIYMAALDAVIDEIGRHADGSGS